MPTASPKETKRDKGWEQRTRTGLFVGYHMQPGCECYGDYWVVDFENLQGDLDACPGQCRMNRTAGMYWDHSNLQFPLQGYRTVQETTVHKGVVEAEEPALTSQLDFVPDAGAPSVVTASTQTGDESQMEWMKHGTGADALDRRGQGEVLPTGRVVRPWKGSKRPPGIDPDVWARFYITREKAQFSKQYDDWLAARRAELEEGLSLIHI